MAIQRSPFRLAVPLFAGLLLVAGLGLTACDGGSGTHSLTDVSYWRTRFAKGEGVATIVEAGPAAIPLLNSLVGDGNELVAQTAAMAAGQIGEPAASVTPAMIEALKRFPGQPYVIDAIRAMKGAAVPYLVPLLDSSDVATQTLGVEALNMIGSEAAPAIDGLMVIIEGDASTDLKKKALVTIGSIGEPAVPMMERLNAVALSNDALRNDAAMANKRIKTAKKVRIKGGDK